MRATSSQSLATSATLLFSTLSIVSAGVQKRALTPPTTLSGAWKSLGCYVDIGRTLSDGGYTDQAAMTDESCISYCASKGFQYAGTEYSSECYCGATMAQAATTAPASDCQMPCSGNAQEPCGAGNRLNVFYSSAPVGPQPNPGVNGFSYIGCYSEGTNGRTLGYNPGLTSTTMTVAVCTAACKAKGYILAGVEYSGECYCDNKPQNGGALVTSGCNSLCNGNQTEFCGGANRLNVYDYQMQYPVSTTTASTSTSATSSISSSTSGVSRSATSASTTTTVSTTTSKASSTSLTTSKTTTSLTTSKTTTSVVSSLSSVSSTSPSISTTTTSVATQATTTGQPAKIAAYTFYGCQTEATNTRALNDKSYADDAMTLESCAAFCAGSTYWGVEYGRECYCGAAFAAGSVVAPTTDCSMVCPGNKFEYCGNGNRLSVYTNKVAGAGTTTSSSSVSVSVSSSTSSMATSSATSTKVSTSTSATVSSSAVAGVPAGWTSYGCYTEGTQGRALVYQAPDSQTLTPQSCANLCNTNGYTISGTEYASQCYCGNALMNGAATTAATDCSMQCSGDATQKCGAGNRLSIISNGTPKVYAAPAAQQTVGNWAYQGCYQDAVNQKRTFYWQIIYQNIMTPKMCLDRCAAYGYMAAGLEYGDECYCGDPANIATASSLKQPDSSCNVVCAGDPNSICGGGSLLSTYFWTGTPFYSWTFPTGAAAGRYDIFANGLTIPLMTAELINGKISFLSKWGTGPANETGAYELDPTLVTGPNSPNAWRALHVKTDIFCAAGIILPDKGGRQLTIGGWAGDSTEGVRLYWPDGQQGTPGTHDWQENVAELKLQKGRWYPSAMVMVNGSILVVGGEVGSNGAAVPSLELLPYTGTAPLYMDWLDRTNPNNLYPFLCVLPSGGIFVAYYNEARILDETTFATIKTLPLAPGAVNDDTAGRTYPLEGASVLLPQKAPYTDPLGILLCGGSTNGPGNALDNCVSTYPELANPTWTLERMPSFRVMPLMAPLPDGTYLIAGGGQHGVAGFGLATTPNLNALLYNPFSPAGSRITVLGNTTLPRMYHSEAITLLDGRVLITGSDPEDDVDPQEYRVETFTPPYLLTGKPRPTFTITNKDWVYGQAGIPFTVPGGSQNTGGLSVTLLGAVSSTHGNSMGNRVLMPAFTCNGGTCTVTAPPNGHIAPPGWYQMFVLDGGVPAVGIYVRIGGDPGALGNWPNYPDFIRPGV